MQKEQIANAIKVKLVSVTEWWLRSDLSNQNHVDIYNKAIKDLPFLESFYKVIEDKDKYDFFAKLINDLKEIKMNGTKHTTSKAGHVKSCPKMGGPSSKAKYS